MDTNKITVEYVKLKSEADAARNLYDLTGSVMDWEWFIRCELKAADFGKQHEEEIDWSQI